MTKRKRNPYAVAEEVLYYIAFIAAAAFVVGALSLVAYSGFMEYGWMGLLILPGTVVFVVVLFFILWLLSKVARKIQNRWITAKTKYEENR